MGNRHGRTRLYLLTLAKLKYILQPLRIKNFSFIKSLKKKKRKTKKIRILFQLDKTIIKVRKDTCVLFMKFSRRKFFNCMYYCWGLSDVVWFCNNGWIIVIMVCQISSRIYKIEERRRKCMIRQMNLIVNDGFLWYRYLEN